MSIHCDTAAWLRRVAQEGGPPSGRAIPLREGHDDMLAQARAFEAKVYERRRRYESTQEAPEAAVAPAERRETGVADPVVARVTALLLSRSAVGIAKYGTTLARTDLSRKDWLVHARDEALDMALYLQRLIDMEDGE